MSCAASALTGATSFSLIQNASDTVHVEVAPGVVIVVAAWMLDPAACAGMAEVHYRWHALYGHRLRRQYVKQRADGDVASCPTWAE